MDIEDLKKIKHSLEECEPRPDVITFGPSYEMAILRRKEALTILRKEIRKLQDTKR